ncbi:CPBP family intramembrane glutamic endopeptidase [Methylobacterium sp. NEAU K]|uniref:CPBP family intramembrane glutamic endopeptidase n=1 Tax=Methylobacterium sp. NEAU K TaxID=3064946 RepID=UPI0027345529|nr:CPBP family intramembrane glutamic endopeptidase [Methylobacterium sp. NEAU K]MDP4005317.1 CPBP family intramembrane metalloprotease [Methylobacterium sp. NEAU K]
MKPDRVAPLSQGECLGDAVAGSAQSCPDAPVARVLPDRGRVDGAWRITWHLCVLVGLVVLYLGAASLLSLVSVRVGFDLWDGIDPFLPPDRRPFLGAVELAHRAFAVDALRQLFLAALVLGGAWWRDRVGWRRRLALERERPNGMRPVALLAILLVWPLLHIAWVTGTAELFGASFGQHVRLSPFMSQAAVAAWLVYLSVMAPMAEELLLRGEAFARARVALGPAGAILVTAVIFAAAHISTWGLARPVSLLPLALALGWLRWRTGRLWPGIALHGWSNLALVTYLLWPP